MTTVLLPTVAYGDPASPPLVYLRGLPSDPGRLHGAEAIGERLILRGPLRGHRVHAVGRPARLERGADMAEIAGLYADAVRRRFDGPVALMGVSTGASVAFQVAVDHPEVVGSLVIAAGAATLGTEGRAVQRRYAELLGDPAAAVPDSPKLDSLLRAAIRVTRSLEDREGLRALVEAEDGFDVRDRLGRVRGPVLVVSGGRDRFYPLSVVDETVRRLPHATHILYANRSHVGTALHPRFADDVDRFLRRAAPTGADLRTRPAVP
ncbi:alpha/beta fold hydrolase [Leifsonia virtsii]|uniref:Alpha/beta hydrolase n=1 Tax=Leifsonia virtsii TaxID=3035915 RepID=A0ABT8J2E9_9MICO|nr:alpha/beta hydrolase [Leifsonia virtsii]MDN4599256.1 alpha/beta hydrolase [Leifsonia virtsii]